MPTTELVLVFGGLGAGAQNTRAWTVESDVDFRRWIFAYGSELLIE
jgi:hypothetical protein